MHKFHSNKHEKDRQEFWGMWAEEPSDPILHLYFMVSSSLPKHIRLRDTLEQKTSPLIGPRRPFSFNEPGLESNTSDAFHNVNSSDSNFYRCPIKTLEMVPDPYRHL
ncbi:hypothetical protein TELCIR_02859 [Teladorsagia circumcincta]|uniref:Uncharacterized protein n=1 Tax=Teladorsagia circumcincta TaxID=45464 RepID=A0A2G9UXY2_TELCI|nr:hypothetical protein TELCIR_02859 [Teladorsagia circumcincta]